MIWMPLFTEKKMTGLNFFRKRERFFGILREFSGEIFSQNLKNAENFIPKFPYNARKTKKSEIRYMRS